MNPTGTLIVVAAPSGAGKSTLVRQLLQRVPGIDFSVSFTTRAPRPAEQDGVAYHFVDEARFRARIAAGGFLEWAEVHGQLYGTGRAETEASLEAGRDVLLDIDVQGAAQIRGSGLPLLAVFVLPPDMQTLRRRLEARRTDTQEAIERRLRRAREEVGEYHRFDYLIVNDELATATEELIAIVRAARCRTARREPQAGAILQQFGAGRGGLG